MSEQIRELAEQAKKYARDYVAECKHYGHYMEHNELEVRFEEMFAKLIVEECRNVVTEVYRNTPLELCGPLLTADEEIMKHFYGVE